MLDLYDEVESSENQVNSSSGIENPSKITPALEGQLKWLLWKCARKLKAWSYRTGVWMCLQLLENAFCRNHLFWPSSVLPGACRRLLLAGFRKCWLHSIAAHCRVKFSEEHFGLCETDPETFLSRIATVDETWIHRWDHETKRESMEWKHRGHPLRRSFGHNRQVEISWQRRFGIWKEICSWTTCHRRQQWLGMPVLLYFGTSVLWVPHSDEGRWQGVAPASRQCPFTQVTKSSYCNSGLRVWEIKTIHPTVQAWPQVIISCSGTWRNTCVDFVFPARMNLDVLFYSGLRSKTKT